MDRSTEYQKLLDDYVDLAKRPARMRNLDESASVTYFYAELAYIGGARDPNDKSLVSKWTRNLHALEDYTKANGFPRDNRRKSESFMPEYRRLLVFVNTELRATTMGNRCTYQRRRLEGIDGYIETSRIDTWATQLEAYRTFVISRGVQPRRRSNDPVERRIANWGDRQRAAYRRGALLEDQVTAVESTVLSAPRLSS